MHASTHAISHFSLNLFFLYVLLFCPFFNCLDNWNQTRFTYSHVYYVHVVIETIDFLQSVIAHLIRSSREYNWINNYETIFILIKKMHNAKILVISSLVVKEIVNKTMYSNKGEILHEEWGFRKQFLNQFRFNWSSVDGEEDWNAKRKVLC